MKRYAILVLLILINVLSYVDRHLLPAFASQISAELALSRQEFGVITGFAFILVYALSGPIMGALADRYNPARVITGGVVIWSIMTALTARAGSFIGLLLPRMAIGVGEATLLPSAAGILSRMFSAHRRATVLSVFFVGTHVGLGLAYWLAGTFGDTIGWRNLFLILGLSGVLFCVPLLLFTPLIGRLRAEGEAAETPQRPMREVLGEFVSALGTSRSFQIALTAFSMLHMLYASSQFMQLWLATEKGLGDTAASSLYGSVYLAVGIPSALFGGLIADWFVQRFKTTRAAFVILIMLLCAPWLFVFRLGEGDSPLFIAAMAISVFMGTFPYGAAVSIILDHAPKAIQSTAAGFAMFAANVLVIGTGTWLIGALADVWETTGAENPLTGVLIGADIFTIAAAGFFLWLHFRDRKETVSPNSSVATVKTPATGSSPEPNHSA